MAVILIHGGCSSRGVPDEEQEQWIKGLFEAGDESFEILRKGGSSIDAVERAVKAMEDNLAYDAGTGSYYNISGEIEMDAMIMDSTGRTGGVIGIRNVRYPISVARKVMEEIPHILLSGEGAVRFARIMGVPKYDPGTEKAMKFLESQLEKPPDSIEKLLTHYRGDCGIAENYSTVGAVAVDDKGILAAATSTGGTPLKLPGRVGDSAIVGAGTYASEHIAASATGMGEGILKLGVTRRVSKLVEKGISVEEACRRVIKECHSAGFVCGVICADEQGNTAALHNGSFMPVMLFNDTNTDGKLIFPETIGSER